MTDQVEQVVTRPAAGSKKSSNVAKGRTKNKAKDQPLYLIDVDEFVRGLRAQHEEWLPIEGNARARLWDMLGNMYVAAPQIEGDPAQMQKLRNVANEDPAVKNSKRFRAWDADVIDLMLVCVLGLGEKVRSTKSQWRAALQAATFANVGRNGEEFKAWLEEVGGIVGANKIELTQVMNSSGPGLVPEADKLELVTVNFDAFSKEVAGDPPTEKVKLAIDPLKDTYEGLGVLLFSLPDAKNPTDIRIVAKLGSPSAVKKVVSEVVHNQIANLSDEEKRERLVDKHLWTLNQVSLALAGRLQLKLKLRHCFAFKKAVGALSKDDAYAHKFFEGASGATYVFPERGDSFSMDVEHPDFVETDPGRYIRGARKGALMPYAPSDPATPDGKAALKDYVLRHVDSWHYKNRR